jgi:hypothetical protein
MGKRNAQAWRSSVTSHMSTLARVPGVSAGSIASNASAPFFMQG